MAEETEFGAELESLRPRLKRIVRLRLDPRLRRRVDSSDVLQEAFADATRRFEEYRADRRVPFFLWVRQLTLQKLVDHHRRHLVAQGRDVRREADAYPVSTSVSLARAIVDHQPSPLEVLERKEREQRLRQALERMKEIDREILMLRHFERLNHGECAELLGLSLSGAKLRYLRALERLREILRADRDWIDGVFDDG